MYSNLQHLLRNKNISIKDFSLTLGVAEKTAYNKLQGITDFTLMEVKKINSCLFPEYDFDYIFTMASDQASPLEEAG